MLLPNRLFLCKLSSDRRCRQHNALVDSKGSCSRLEPGRWHDLHLEWDSAKSECRVQLDGRPVARLEQSRDTLGACYLRLRSTADSTDSAGLVVEAVKVAVSERS